jgi:hypothetical protein
MSWEPANSPKSIAPDRHEQGLGVRPGNGGRSGERGGISFPLGHASRKEMTCLTCQTFQPQVRQLRDSLAPCAVDPSPSGS